VLRSDQLIAKGQAEIQSYIADLIAGTEWADMDKQLPFYVVGGSWRGLARVDMFDTGYPLTVFHNYHIAKERIGPLVDRVIASSRDDLRAIPRLASSRIATLSNAAQLLQAVTSLFQPSHIVVSSYGLREGLVFENMDEATRTIDPLLDSTRRFGRYQSRHGSDGTALYDWLLGAFPTLDKGYKRLLLAACHLSDIGWQANPDFRAERALEVALHGNWVGIDATGRAMLAQSLYTSFGGGSSRFTNHERLCSYEELDMAIGWGLAIRAGQRLSGGREEILRRSRLAIDGRCLKLELTGDDKNLQGESVQRRIGKLASYLSLDCQA
jgi:exopolyphosphatase/guanosine-5'-triphosphate,3'-diphosphate pyrophosphatase